MKGRDCLLLFFCLTALWISLPSSSNLSVVQKWRIPFDASVFKNSHFPEEWEKLPLPVVTDINEDGQNDIIYVNTEFEINIASSEDIYQLGEEISDSSMVAFSSMKALTERNTHLKMKIPELTATYTETLLPQFGISYGRRPVAMAVGYIDPPGIVKRKQVIVVLTELWGVLCYNHKLELLWESHPVSDPNTSLYHKEATITIDPTPLTNGDRGVIIVGGRKEQITSSGSSTVSHEHFDKKEFKAGKEELEKLKQLPLTVPERKRVRNLQEFQDGDESESANVNDNPGSLEEENHFSYYAFEGHTGALRWKHEPADFQDQGSNSANLEQALDLFAQPMADAEIPDNSLKLHLFHNLRHLGERDWTFFEQDIRDELPFVWRTREDTYMSTAYFERKRSFGEDFGGTDDDDARKRNVLIAHTTHGIEVIHLYSGRPLTRLELSPESLYLDINNDGVIDKIQAVPEKPQRGSKPKRKSIKKKNEESCLAVATSGVPTTMEKLFEQNVCSSTGLMFHMGLDKMRGASENIDMANPTFSFAGNGRYNTIFLVSSGKVSCLSPEGDILWQVNTGATWSKVDDASKQNRATRYAKVESFLEMGGFPSVQPFNLYSRTDLITAVGYHTLSIVSTVTGNLEAEAKLSSVVNGPVIIGDWDSDGDNDLIVPCINGFVGLRVTKGSGTPLYSIMFGVIILALPILYFSDKTANAKSKRSKQQQRTTTSFEESMGMM